MTTDSATHGLRLYRPPEALPAFSIKGVGEVVRGLERHQPLRYWLDVTASLVVGNAAFHFYAAGSTPAVTVAAFFIAAAALYRASMFLHEIQHLREGTFTAFKVYWNLFCGIPFLIPSYTYADHRGHHVNRDYGTADDAEYLQLMNRPVRSFVYMASRVVWLPVVLALRYLLLPPAALISPTVRHRTWQYAARVTAINVSRNRRLPDPDEERLWLLQDFGCFAYCWAVLGLMYCEVLPWTLLLKIGMLSTFIIGVSHLRTLTSHRFRNAGEEMSYVEQLLDSTTIPGGPIWTELWCPIGMRYHALHHLVPSLPYHNMAEAHRRVMEAFPDDNPYRRTIRNGLIDALRDLVGSFWEARRGSRKLPEQRDRAAA